MKTIVFISAPFSLWSGTLSLHYRSKQKVKNLRTKFHSLQNEKCDIGISTSKSERLIRKLEIIQDKSSEQSLGKPKSWSCTRLFNLFLGGLRIHRLYHGDANNHALIILFAISILLTLNSCSGKLNRSRAQSIIEKTYSLPYPASEKLNFGKILHSKNFGGSDLSLEKDLQANNLIEFTSMGEERQDAFFKGDGGYSYSAYNLELTPVGKKFVLGSTVDKNGNKAYIVKTADIDVIEVTGILERPELNGFEVDFTWHYSNITPFGEAYTRKGKNRNSMDRLFGANVALYEADKIYTSQALFVKYDDGWRIMENSDEHIFNSDSKVFPNEAVETTERPIAENTPEDQHTTSEPSNPVSAGADPGKFEGAWFEIDIPKGFSAIPSLKSTTADGYESVFLRSPDQRVEFYVFSPQWNGEPSDIALNPSTEKQLSSETKASGTDNITWYSIEAQDGSYKRAYQDTKSKDGSIRWVIGIKYDDQDSYNLYKNEYLAFKKSLVQFGD